MIAALPVIAIGVVLLVRQAAERERGRAVEARLVASAAHRQAADDLATRALEARRTAFATFTAKGDGEPAWQEAQRLTREADARYRDAELELEAAFSIDAAAVRSPMAEVLDAHVRLATSVRDTERAAELVHRLGAYDPARAASWTRPATLAISLDRPAAIAIHAMRPEATRRITGGYDATPIANIDARAGERIERELPAGSYVAVVSAPDGHLVRDPFVVEPGERLVRDLVIPPPRPGWVFVGAGRFRFGSRADDAFRTQFLVAQPEHDRELPAFWIARTEVTFEDWLRFLRASSDDAAEAHRPTLATTQNTVGLERGADGRYELELVPTSGATYRVREGAALEYSGRAMRRRVRWEKLPVVGVSYDDALAYAAWLDRSGEMTGARPCTSLEWERAARGADGRSYPHGERLAADDANFDETYGRDALSFGPDEVGSHPISDSPYGVADLVGNVWEATTGLDGKPWRKGGSFYQDRASALATNNAPSEPTQRGIRYGIRMCAPAR